MKIRTCKKCRKQKPIYAKGLCKSCYHKSYRKSRKDKGLCVRCGRYPICYKSKVHCINCYNNVQYTTDRIRLGIK
jgi:hypothetical protein